MRVPTSTYRLQINAAFPFARVRQLVDYFEALGVGDLYFSPVFQARPNSPHGYDVTNPAQFNREVGDEEQFEELSGALRDRGIGIVLDIVPNHMAASEENPVWRDVLEHGPSSIASGFFDVEWDAPGCDSHIVLPVLGRRLKDAVEAGEIKVQYQDGELVLAYFQRIFPIDPASYAAILRHVPSVSGALIVASESIKHRRAGSAEEKATRRQSAEALKKMLAEWVAPETNRIALEDALNALSTDDVWAIANNQPYQLEFWRTGTARINYRRFFDITDLAGVRVEDPEVFEATHSLILELLKAGEITGVRVDHVDGLRDPEAYLEALRAAVGDAYVVVEKILGAREVLRESWPVQGTTGYDFTGLLTGMFCEPTGLETLANDYQQRTGLPEFNDVVYEKKKLVIENLFAGELVTLARELERIAKTLNVPVGDTALRHCITEVSAALEVYRTYIRSDEIDERDRTVITRALARAEKNAPRVLSDGFQLLGRVLLNDDIPAHAQPARLGFIANWQQFTGPATAKGVEDTAFYTHHRLIALNEVGGHPAQTHTSTDSFHAWLQQRAPRWPHTLNTSSTHDTKRSEDVRARIQVLSELADEWTSALDRWIKLDTVPEVNEQILIYQTLIGAWPLSVEERTSLPDRMHAFLQKAAREAKEHSSWLDPDEAYEKQLYAFVDALLANDRFLADFAPLQQKTAWYGALNSLSQIVLKLGAPGVPDIYQGNESWNFSLVDPDNRRPVDFKGLAASLNALPDNGTSTDISQMMESWPDGRIKLHVTRAGLKCRRAHSQLFADGEYIAVKTQGRFANNVIAFARRRENEWALIVAGRYFTQVAEQPIAEAWDDTSLILPGGAPTRWSNVFTDEVVASARLSEILRTAPFAMLRAHRS